MLQPVRLYTQTGDFVAEIHIPPFEPQPEIIMWGSRTFIHAEEHYGGYRETFTWYHPQSGDLRLIDRERLEHLELLEQQHNLTPQGG